MIHERIIRNQDELSCSHCGKTWDANDPDPPACSKDPNRLTLIPVQYVVPDESRAKAYVFHDHSGYGFLVYAPSLSAAVDFVGRTMSVMTNGPEALCGLTVHTYTRMDGAAHTRTPRYELSPRVLAEASLTPCNTGECFRMQSITQFLNRRGTKTQ